MDILITSGVINGYHGILTPCGLWQHIEIEPPQTPSVAFNCESTATTLIESIPQCDVSKIAQFLTSGKHISVFDVYKIMRQL